MAMGMGLVSIRDHPFAHQPSQFCAAPCWAHALASNRSQLIAQPAIVE